MKRATNSPRVRVASSIRRLLAAIAVDAGLLLVFLYATLGHTPSVGSPGVAEEPAIGPPSAPQPEQAPIMPGIAALKTDIEITGAVNKADLGVVLRDAQGNVRLDVGSDRPFVLASVAKVYIMAAFLDTLWKRGVQPSEEDRALLDDMIRYSDNEAASALWKRIGREKGLHAFLASKGLRPLNLLEGQDSWGTMYATAGEVSEMLWRLAGGGLLDPASTSVALDLLSNVWEEQRWGVSAGVKQRGDVVMLKNGWYPEDDGWRVNSAGVVEKGDNFYVLVIMAYPTDGFEEGVSLVESIARRVNASMPLQ